MEDYIPWLIIGGVVLLVLIFVVGSYYYEKKRTEAFTRVAAELGLAFDKGDSIGLVSSLGAFPLFSQGHSKRATNLVHGETDEVRVAIFDYQYTTGHGKHAHTYKQSVIRFQSAALDLPDFVLRPEHLFDKIGGVFGSQDIDFDTHPRFSSRYLLRGSDEAAVRRVFRNEVLTYFEEAADINVEGDGNQLIVYHASRRIKPNEVQGLMEEGFKFYGLFKSA